MRVRHAAAAAALLSVLSAPLQAHHSFAAYDTTRILTLNCVVKEFQWANPHSSLTCSAPDAQGIVQDVRFEGVPPTILVRSGWTQDTLLVGDRITLGYHPMKDGSPGGYYVSVTLPNGKRLGTSGSSFIPPAPPAPAHEQPSTPERPAAPPNPIITD